MNDLTSGSSGIAARRSQNGAARNQAVFGHSSSQDDVAESQPAFTLFDWKRAHAELVGLAHQQARLDTRIGRWLLYARRATTHTWLGYASINEYAQQLFGFTPRQTQERLRVAEALEDLTMLNRAFGQGTLCWSAVRELTRVATPETESQWLAAAQGRSAHEIEEMVKGRARGDGPDDRVRAALLRRVLRFELSPATYATVQEALTRIRREAGGKLDDDEALLLMARRVLGGPTDEGRSSYQIAISMCPGCERGFQHAGGELVELSPTALDTACCDAQHIGDVRTAGCRGEEREGEGDSEPAGDSERDDSESEGEREWEREWTADTQTHVGAHTDSWRDGTSEADRDSESQREWDGKRESEGERERPDGQRGGEREGSKRECGRATRAKQNLPPRIRRLVLRRARQQCEVPTCRNAIFLDVHHRTLRSEGGTHDENALVALCGAHHTAIHEGRLLIEGDARSGWRFRHADGTAYGTAPAPQLVDVAVKVFRGLCALGFKQGDARKALDHVTRQTHLGAAMTTERMLRDAVLFLTR